MVNFGKVGYAMGMFGLFRKKPRTIMDGLVGSIYGTRSGKKEADLLEASNDEAVRRVVKLETTVRAMELALIIARAHLVEHGDRRAPSAAIGQRS